MFTCLSPACDYTSNLTHSCLLSRVNPTALSVAAPSEPDHTRLCQRKDSTSNLHPRCLSCSTWLFWRTLKKNCLKHMQREIWLTRNQFILLSVEWTKGPVASRIRWLQLSQPQKSEEKSSQRSVFHRIFFMFILSSYFQYCCALKNLLTFTTSHTPGRPFFKA